MIDSEHTFLFELDGVDVTDYVDPESVSLQDAEGGEIDTLAFELTDTAAALTATIWDEVALTLDEGEAGETVLFGGYVVSTQARYTAGGTGRVWMVRCEGYGIMLQRAEMPQRSWVGSTAKAIIGDLFTAAGLSDFDVTTYVSDGATPESFAVERTETLAEALHRLAQLSDYVWRVDGAKALHFGAAASDPAPFQVCDAATANYSTKFPATAGTLTFGRDGFEIVNKVVVIGGSKPSAEIVDTFTGDGATMVFRLTYRDIIDIWVSVDGDLYADGTDWWHDYTERQVLTNYREGTISFEAAPAVGADIEAHYRYNVQLVYEDSDAGSIATYGRTFVQTVVEPGITTEAQATAVATAILAERADGIVTGSFEIHRLGLRAGQQVTLTFTKLGISGGYVVQGVQSGMKASLDGMVSQVRFGGRTTKISDLLPAGGGSTGSGEAYPPLTRPAVDGDVGTVQVGQNGVILAIDPRTTWVAPV